MWHYVLLAFVLMNMENYMNKVFKKFDMKAPPFRQRQWLRPVTWALSLPDVSAQHTKIIKTNCEGLKPPLYSSLQSQLFL